MKIDDKINKIKNELAFMKLVVNSNYGINPNNIQSVMKKRWEKKNELGELYKLKARRTKINKIKNNII